MPGDPGNPEAHRWTGTTTRQRAGGQLARAQRCPLLVRTQRCPLPAHLSQIPSLSRQLQFRHRKHHTCQFFPPHTVNHCGCAGAPLLRPAPPTMYPERRPLAEPAQPSPAPTATLVAAPAPLHPPGSSVPGSCFLPSLSPWLLTLQTWQVKNHRK